MHYLGIDISKLKFDVCLLVDENYKTKIFSNDLVGFRKFNDWLESHSNSDVHICMEGTGRLWEPLAEYLSANQRIVSVTNPACVKGYADSELRRSKNDMIDAKIIARFCRANSPTVWVQPLPQVKSIRDIQRHIDALKVDCVREGNRLKSGVLDALVEKSIKSHLAYLTDEIAELEQEVKQRIADDDNLTEEYELLTSIVGVGQVTATTILGELGSHDRFGSSRELEIFCGIAPRVFKSGSSVRGRTRISKKGNARIRKALYMSALSSMRHNPQLRKFADRLRAKNKPGKVIVCAVMRKLLRIMFSILKTKVKFDPEYHSPNPNLA